MEFKQLLKSRRTELGLSQAQLAERMSELGQETSSARVGHWETGRNRPPLEDPKFPRALATALEMDANDLMMQLGYVAGEEDRSPVARRVAGIIDRLPEEIQTLALEFLVLLEKRYARPPKHALEVATIRLEEAETILSTTRGTDLQIVSSVFHADAALDITLREIWHHHLSPSDERIRDNREKSLNELVDDLHKASVFKIDQVNQVKIWLEMIDRTSRGLIVDVQRKDIEALLDGIRHLITEYLWP